MKANMKKTKHTHCVEGRQDSTESHTRHTLLWINTLDRNTQGTHIVWREGRIPQNPTLCGGKAGFHNKILWIETTAESL